jgi:hypothetical protein
MYAVRAGYAFSFISKSVLGQVHSLFRIAFYKQWDLAQPSSISTILSFPYVHPIAAYVFFLVFPSVLSFLLSPFNNAVYGSKKSKENYVTSPSRTIITPKEIYLPLDL